MNSNDAVPTVLIIDDEPDDVFILRHNLVAAGCKHRLVVFPDGEDVLIYLKGICAMARGGSGRIPALMFCDINMPRVDGFEVLTWVRAEPVLAAMPVVMISSSELPEDCRRASTLGAFQYLVKHPDRTALAGVLQRAAFKVATGATLF